MMFIYLRKIIKLRDELNAQGRPNEFLNRFGNRINR